MPSTAMEIYIKLLKQAADPKSFEVVKQGMCPDTLQTLYRYGCKVDHITEFGVYTGCSTRAFMAGKPKKMVGVDIVKQPEVDHLITTAFYENINYDFIEKSSTEIEIEPTDLLFFDSFHSDEHLTKEFKLHQEKVRKYLIFHDLFWDKYPVSETFWRLTEEYKGIWKLREVHYYTYGLGILERVE